MALSDDFARAFGDYLKEWLDNRGIKYSSAAKRLGVTKAALSTYWTDDVNGKRRKPRAELLFRACMELEDFVFEYNGYRVTAEVLGKPQKARAARITEQFRIDFSRQFKLTEDNGQVAVHLKRHPGRVEVSVSLKAAS